MNPDLGPSLKCALGHDSIKDSTIIKSYWLKVGLVHFQNQHISFVYFRCSTSTSMNAENKFPGNSFAAFNWSPILQVSRVGYIAEIGSSTSPGNEFPGNSLAAFRAVDMERRKRIPRESVFDRAKKSLNFFLLRFCLPSRPASQQASKPASKPATSRLCWGHCG